MAWYHKSVVPFYSVISVKHQHGTTLFRFFSMVPQSVVPKVWYQKMAAILKFEVWILLPLKTNDYRQINTDRETDKQLDRQTDRHTNTRACAKLIQKVVIAL